MTDMNAGYEDTLRIAERAARYLGALTESEPPRAAFLAWLAESPRHVEEFLLVLKSAQDIATLTPEQAARIESLAREGVASSSSSTPTDSNVVELAFAGRQEPPLSVPVSLAQKRKKQRLSTWTAATAAVLSLAALVWWQLVGPIAWRTYETDVGEQRAIKLADGSMVVLNTHSRLSVRFTSDARALRLLEGQALFTVERDSSRPFRVDADGAVIEALGTQFDVYRRAAGTRVAVLEGAVRISPQASSPAPGEQTQSALPRLSAGEEVNLDRKGRIAERQPLNPIKTTAWRQRRLVFEDEPLQTIAEEFNRYNIAPQIHIADAAARAQRFSGTFSADEPERMVQTLMGDDTLVVTRNGKEVVIGTR